MIFVDTGAFLARYLERDQHHAEAVRVWDELAAEGARLFTSNFILDETMTLLARRAGHAFAVERGRRMWGSAALTILRPDARDEAEALSWMDRLSDQGVSFTDCVSFALMRRQRLRRVFGFDRHFNAAGFDLRP